jgi:predicted Co/Zn/Cd cation transporter (cation efflux family)
MIGIVLFIVAEGIMALITSSQSILMDTVYGAADFLTVIISIRIIPLLYKPTTEKHPFGYSQTESIFIMIKGSMLTAVTVGLVLNNIQIMLKGGNSVPFTSIAIFELAAAFVCILILAVLVRMNRNVDSAIVKAEIGSWVIDSVASIGLAIAFILPAVIHTAWIEQLTPYLDQIVAITLSVMILPMPVKTAISGVRDLFLFAPDEDTVARIKEVGQQVLSDHQFEQTIYDIVKTGRKIWISIYFECSEDMISVALIKQARNKIEEELKKEFPDLYVELIPEFEH